MTTNDEKATTTTETPRVEPRWGLEAPAGVTAAWGARAIYHAPTGVDIVWDRQGFHGDAKEVKRLERWLNTKGLRALRRLLRQGGEYLARGEHREVRLERDGYVLVANPRASYGYLYLGAWRDPSATAAPVKLTAAQRRLLAALVAGVGNAEGWQYVTTRQGLTAMRLAARGLVEAKTRVGSGERMARSTDAGRALLTGGAK